MSDVLKNIFTHSPSICYFGKINDNSWECFMFEENPLATKEEEKENKTFEILEVSAEVALNAVDTVVSAGGAMLSTTGSVLGAVGEAAGSVVSGIGEALSGL
jgi:hypothetical protein